MSSSLLDFKLEEIKLPLNFDWKISRSELKEKTNFIVRIKGNSIEGRGEIAINPYYGESLEKTYREFDRFLNLSPETLTGLEELGQLELDAEVSTNLKCGIEMAFMDYLSKLSGRNLYELLGMAPVHKVKTSFSLPIMDASFVKPFIEKYKLSRFQSLKIKISNIESLDMAKEVFKNYDGKVRFDANEGFKKDPDQVVRFLESFDSKRIEFMEQPLKTDAHDESLYLKSVSKILLVADESITSHEVTDYYKDRFDYINVKLMKSGGHMNAIRQCKQAHEKNLKVLLGCMIETSLGIYNAFILSSLADAYDLDGFLLIKKDPFALLHEENGQLFSPSLL